MITIGAPSAAFLREIADAYAEDHTGARVLEVAAKHGVKPHF
jgi:hypothetical protein